MCAICSSVWTLTEGVNQQGRRSGSVSWFYTWAVLSSLTRAQPDKETLHQLSRKFCPPLQAVHLWLTFQSHFLVSPGLKLQHHSVELIPVTPDFAERSSCPYLISKKAENLCSKVIRNMCLNSGNTSKYTGQEQLMDSNRNLCLTYFLTWWDWIPCCISQIKLLSQSFLHTPNSIIADELVNKTKFGTDTQSFNLPFSSGSLKDAHLITLLFKS